MMGFKIWLESKEEIYGWIHSTGKYYISHKIFSHTQLVLKNPGLKKYVKPESLQYPGPEYVYIDMWKAGFLRISTVNDILYFEGEGNIIKLLYQKCKDLAENYGKTAKFRNINRESEGEIT